MIPGESQGPLLQLDSTQHLNGLYNVISIMPALSLRELSLLLSLRNEQRKDKSLYVIENSE